MDDTMDVLNEIFNRYNDTDTGYPFEVADLSEWALEDLHTVLAMFDNEVADRANAAISELYDE